MEQINDYLWINSQKLLLLLTWGLGSSGSVVYFPTKVALDFQTAETVFRRDISEQNGLTHKPLPEKQQDIKDFLVGFHGKPVLQTDGNPLQTRPVRSDAQ